MESGFRGAVHAPWCPRAPSHYPRRCVCLGPVADSVRRPIRFTGFSRLGIASPRRLVSITLPGAVARSLERRNGIYRAVNATFQRFIIGPIHSLIHRFDRGAPLVNGPYDIMYIACYPTRSPSCPTLEPSLISVMTDNFPPYAGSAASNSILISGISSSFGTQR